MATAHRVLIVDECKESREVLRALLARRGAEAVEASHPEQAAQLTYLHNPDVIVFDAESDHCERRTGTEQLRTAASSHRTPVILLGTTLRESLHVTGCQFVSKPYHYGPLLRKIETLLAR